jgi:hypothetical protein
MLNCALQHRRCGTNFHAELTKENPMSRIHSKTSNYLGRALTVFGAAVAAAAAAESHHQPRSRDLRTLGVDPQAFSKIRLR